MDGTGRSILPCQAQVAVSTVALSAAVTACEGMGQWELALHLFFQNSIGLSCSGIVGDQVPWNQGQISTPWVNS